MFILNFILIAVLSRIWLLKLWLSEAFLGMVSMSSHHSKFNFHSPPLYKESINQIPTMQITRVNVFNTKQLYFMMLDQVVLLNFGIGVQLGYSSAKAVQKILSCCNIYAINKMQNSVCAVCCYGKSHKFPFAPSNYVMNHCKLYILTYAIPQPID